jgi:NO-binding membrane sensor protein with MHYT domain
MASAEELGRLYEGQIVPRSFNASYVALSYVVSFIGALSTLELINRRTAPRGLFNHILLVGSAVTMGGVAIWCMHFIGSLAIVLAEGEAELQIVYSSTITAVSFFVPIVVLIAAFVAIGAGSRHSWPRVLGSGILAGSAICGMHYLGNASISNYTCVYQPAYVVGAALIAATASTVALFIFFVYRAAWANSWWKTLGCGVLLAGAVSGMHWCAAVGTAYRLKKISASGGMSRSATVIVVITLVSFPCSGEGGDV